MKKITLISILSLFIIFFACEENNSEDTTDQTNNTENISEEDLVFKAVEELPEFKDANEHIRALTGGEQGVQIIMHKPTEEIKEYYMQVGYNQESWFETYYHFFVDPKTMEITIEDIIEGDVVSLDTWRKRNETR